MSTKTRKYTTHYGMVSVRAVIDQMIADGVIDSWPYPIQYIDNNGTMRCLFCNATAINKPGATPWIKHHREAQCIFDPEVDH